MTTRTLYTGTLEYLDVIISADEQLIDQTIEISFDRTTWLPAQWIGEPGTTRTAHVLLGDTNPLPAAGINAVYARLTDNPEIPIMLAGKVLVR